MDRPVRSSPEASEPAFQGPRDEPSRYEAPLNASPRRTGRRSYLVGQLGLVLLATPFAAWAQLAKKAPRIGYLSAANPVRDKDLMEAFRQGLREQGYVEGSNVSVEYRRGWPDQLPALAAELVRLETDVIVALGAPAALAAKQATSSIPVVMTLVGDPIGVGIVPSLARPGGNITGLSMHAPAVWAKALSLLKEVVPKASRVLLLLGASNPGQVASLSEVYAAAKVLGIAVERFDVRSSKDFEVAFATALKQGADALYVFPVPMDVTDAQRIAQFTIKNRLPMLMTTREDVERAQGLMSYSVNILDEARRTGPYIDRILKGAKPATLPVQQPTTFQLVINLKTAKALGLTVPQSVLLQADMVIN